VGPRGTAYPTGEVGKASPVDDARAADAWAQAALVGCALGGESAATDKKGRWFTRVRAAPGRWAVAWLLFAVGGHCSSSCRCVEARNEHGLAFFECKWPCASASILWGPLAACDNVRFNFLKGKCAQCAACCCCHCYPTLNAQCPPFPRSSDLGSDKCSQPCG